MHTRRSRLPRRFLLGLLLGVVSASCGRDPVFTETPAPGEPAQIVWRILAVAGGREVRQETRYDSLTARYTVLSCNDAPVSVPCTTLRVDREGTIVTPTVATLFAATTTRAFQALAERYPKPRDVTSPDYAVGSLVITRNGRRKTIAWDGGASLPLTLVEFQCSLQVARGDLLLCD